MLLISPKGGRAESLHRPDPHFSGRCRCFLAAELRGYPGSGHLLPEAAGSHDCRIVGFRLAHVFYPGMTRLLHWLPAVFYAGLIFSLSHQSRPAGGNLGPDYVLHFFEYGFFALTLVWGATRGTLNRIPSGYWVALWLVSVLYAVLDEWHQSFLPERDASLEDVIADAVGALVFLILAHLILRWRGTGVAR